MYFIPRSVPKVSQNIPILNENLFLNKSQYVTYLQQLNICLFLYQNTLQMFCLLNPQMNACKPNPKTTSSSFNRQESVTKIFCIHAISKDICLLFKGSFVLLLMVLLNNSAVFHLFTFNFSSHLFHISESGL